MRSLTRSLLALALAIAFAVFTNDASAADKKAPKDNSLRGKITAVDKDAKTLTIAGYTLNVDDTTEISNSGKPGKLEDLKPGTEATVTTFKLGEKVMAVKIKTGAVAPTAAPAKKKK